MGGSIRRSSFPIGANASSIIWGERIVGTAGALVRDGYPTAIHGIRTGYIFGVRVEPAYRGNGIAARLTRACIEFLREIECIEIRLHASDAGRPIYERLGFSPTNEMRLT
ncbi:MAG: GNAT family N-acetyltransferase [Vulcanimicrobiaceae bacterium]